MSTAIPPVTALQSQPDQHTHSTSTETEVTDAVSNSQESVWSHTDSLMEGDNENVVMEQEQALFKTPQEGK